MTDNRSNISQPVNAKTACAANAQRSLVMDAVGNFALGEIRGHIPGHIPINLQAGASSSQTSLWEMSPTKCITISSPLDNK